MTSALGLPEMDGAVAMIDAADAMLKVANACLPNHEVFDPGCLTLVVKGDLAACHAALDAGCAAMMCIGRVTSRKEIGRPDDDTQWLLIGSNRQPKQPIKEPDVSVIVAESADELLALLTSVRQGMTAGEVAAHFGWPLEKARNAPKQFFSVGTLRRRSSHYRLEPHQPAGGVGCPITPGINIMKKTRTANLRHLYHEPLPENLKLTLKVEVGNVHRRQTTDVYEHALTVTAWQQIYDQLHPGKFRDEFAETLLDDIQVLREYTDLVLHQLCPVWPNLFWLGIPATRGKQGFIGSQCLGNAEIAARPGGIKFELSMPDDYTILGVVLSEDVIIHQTSFSHNPNWVLHMLRSQPVLEVKEQHKAALQGFVQQVLVTFCENPENLHQPAVREVLGDNLLVATGAMSEEAQPMMTAENISHQSHRRLLSRVCEYALENMSEPVTVLGLYSQPHVSCHTLQNVFYAILDIGPNMWLRRIRLNTVRREPTSPWSQSITIKNAAVQWGFWHLGQFVADYQ